MAGNFGGYFQPQGGGGGLQVVGSGSIVPSSVTSGVVSSGAVTGRQAGGFFTIASGSIGGLDIAASTITSGNYSSGSLSWAILSSGIARSGHLADASAVSGTYSSGSIFQFHLASPSIFSGQISSGSVGQFHQSSPSTFSGQIASGNVSINHLASGVVAGIVANNGTGIASLNFSGSSAQFNSGVIFTTTTPGLYRLASYVVVLQGNATNLGFVSVLAGWTDDSEPQTGSPVSGIALSASGDFGQGMVVIRSTSGKAVNISTNLTSLTGTPVFSCFNTLERLA